MLSIILAIDTKMAMGMKEIMRVVIFENSASNTARKFLTGCEYLPIDPAEMPMVTCLVFMLSVMTRLLRIWCSESQIDLETICMKLDLCL